MREEENTFARNVADICMATYNSLGKQGKPEKGREWTKMACIVKSHGDSIDVVSLATGTKCIGEKSRNDQGTVLNDSHAEVLARRLFIKYLFKQLLLSSITSDGSDFERCCETHLYKLKKNIKFHLFTTDTPCGDAAIFPSNISHKRKSNYSCSNIKKKKYCDGEALSDETANMLRDDNNGESSSHETHAHTVPDDGNDRSLSEEVHTNMVPDDNNDESLFDETDGHIVPVDENDNSEEVLTSLVADHVNEGHNLSSKCNKNKSTRDTILYSSDIHRTGAKCVPKGVIQDLLEPGSLYHQTGALRIKPGRGERTLSMSCSDKIMKWCVLGLTGGLLSNFLTTPIFLSSIVINSNYDKESVTRALSLRGRNIDNKLKLHLPTILSSSVRFADSVAIVNEHCNSNYRVTPAGAAILWCKVCDIYEVSVQGRKHGFTKKNRNSLKASTSICKRNLFLDFKRFLEISGNTSSILDGATYSECKHACKYYEETRKEFFQMFSDWTEKNKEEERFHLNDI